MLTLDNFETAISPQILLRGKEYFKNQAVESLEENPPGTWTASVEGTEVYDVVIILSGKIITDQSCDCPYDGGVVCKHVVAVLYALHEQAVKPKKPSKKPGKLTFEDLLLKTNLEELRNFIRHHKQENRDFGEKFVLFFAEKDPGMDIGRKYEGMVRQIARSNSSRGFMTYRQTFSFSKEIRSVQHAAETALSQKNYRDAMSIGKVICNEAMQLIQACDDSAGNIGGVLSSGIRIFEGIAEAATAAPELLGQLLDHLEKTLVDKDWFNYGDFGYELLQVAEKTAMRTEPERYPRLLDALTKVHVGPYSDYKQEYFQKEKIRFYEKTGRLEEAAKLISANMEIVEVRRAEVQKNIDQKDFARAKQLIAEGIRIAEDKKHPGTVGQWEEVLLDIARAEKDVTAERYFTKKFAFDRGLNAGQYQAWKATFSPEEWGQVIEAHIKSVIVEEKATPRRGVWDTLEYALYKRLAPIFIQEEQWERLLKVVPKHPSEKILDEIHPYLSKRYPAEMLAFYLKVLEKLGDNASNRREYEHLAALMKKVKKDIEGSHPAIDGLAADLIQKYQRRPAMLEEIRKVVGR
jgi:SWIM zinc finger